MNGLWSFGLRSSGHCLAPGPAWPLPAAAACRGACRVWKWCQGKAVSDHSIVRSVVLVLGLGSSFKMTGQKVFRKPFRKESPNPVSEHTKNWGKIAFFGLEN